MASVVLPKPVGDPVVKYKQIFIGNEWLNAEDGETLPVYNPSTTEEICRVALSKKTVFSPAADTEFPFARNQAARVFVNIKSLLDPTIDVDKAVTAARSAFRPGSEWRNLQPSRRAVLINKLADLLERDTQYVATLESLNNGKVFSRVFSSDIPKCVEVFRYFAGWTNKGHGKTIPVDGDYLAYTRHEPIGVCGAIIPWNVPMIMLAWKTAPCLAAGNTLVLKPADLTPLTALYFASLVKEAGFPPGVFNVVPGLGEEAGSAVALHMDIDNISFTGSVSVGRLILKASAESNFKKVTLEMGGKNPMIIFPDVDLQHAVEMAHVAIFSQGGQVCCSGSKTFVHADIYDEFVKFSVRRAKTRKLGNALDPTVDQGPQISDKHQAKILRMISDGVKAGCTLLCGGGVVDGLKGHFVQPTVLVDIDDKLEIAKEEIFGPVQLIFKFTSLEEVITRSNDSCYGLSAGVMTNDINKAMAAAKRLQVGMVWVNCFFELSAAAPFGGYKQSGIGRDLGEHALMSYMETKTVYIKEPPIPVNDRKNAS